MKKTLGALGTSAIVVMLTAIVTVQMYKMLLSQIPPVAYDAISTEQATVKAGEEVKIVIDIHRKRFCRPHLDMFIKSEETGRVILRKSVAGGASDLGKERVRSAHLVPADAEPGVYEFITRGYYDCEEGMHVILFPTVKFRVTK